MDQLVIRQNDRTSRVSWFSLVFILSPDREVAGINLLARVTRLFLFMPRGYSLIGFGWAGIFDFNQDLFKQSEIRLSPAASDTNPMTTCQNLTSKRRKLPQKSSHLNEHPPTVEGQNRGQKFAKLPLKFLLSKQTP